MFVISLTYTLKMSEKSSILLFLSEAHLFTLKLRRAEEKVLQEYATLRAIKAYLQTGAIIDYGSCFKRCEYLVRAKF